MIGLSMKKKNLSGLDVGPLKDTASEPHCAGCNAAVGDWFCSSLVIITRHLIASVAIKALVASPEWREL